MPLRPTNFLGNQIERFDNEPSLLDLPCARVPEKVLGADYEEYAKTGVLPKWYTDELIKKWTQDLDNEIAAPEILKNI